MVNLRVLKTAVWLATLSSCSAVLGTRDCTLIGCESGVTVHLELRPTLAFRVEVFARSPDQQPAYVFECPNAGQCGQDIFFPGLIADRLFIRVTTAAGSRLTEIVQVQYQSSRPNGPDCDPDCRQATVTAAVPV